jgi:hypothetical protein
MTERYHCTPENPWRPGLPTPVTHHDTHEVGEQEDGWPGGDIVTYECKTCGARWRQELPQ